MPVRVVVAYDFAPAGDGVARALQADPCIEVVAQSSRLAAAPELVQSLEPDVVIVDLRMPDLDALAVVDKLRASLADIRVLVITDGERTCSMREPRAARVASYLTRCRTGDELRRAVSGAQACAMVTPSLASTVLEACWSPACGEDAATDVLQRRELDVLRLVVQRKTDKQIGAELYISPRTVQVHLTQIREKTGLRERSELTRWAAEHAIG
jgi:DNA-binding NarL/FixJ family response regulator